ncbi:MAG: hypothetical protein BBJ57_06060 [Desulfobacterales bacterium PC51MH44]|nr:MAG: hypothetical protein BBJ57_06060 [Desulfobacterales bacterium PC51MH44]
MNECKSQLKTHHKFLDFLYWNLVLSVPFITACVAIVRNSMVGLIFYIIVCILLTLVIYRFFCIHCPHYSQSGNYMKCMFFWGVPKFFKAKPGPLKLIDKTVAMIATIIIILLPLYWLLLQPGFLVIYFLSLGVMGATLRRYECGRCIYFQCPANCVPEDLKG